MLPEDVIAIDSETRCFAAGYHAPHIVCLSGDDGTGAWLAPTPEARDVLAALLASGATLVLHNAAYDSLCAMAWWGLTEPILAAYDDGRILDTMLIERIAEIGGRPRKDLSLANLHAAHGLGELPKDAAVRTSYGPLLDLPLAAYSPEQTQYAEADATATWRVYQRQRARYTDVAPEDVAHLARKMLVMGGISAWGLRTDPTRLDALKVACAEHLGALRSGVQGLGIIRPDGTKNMQVLRGLVTEAFDGHPPMTEPPREKKGVPPRVKAFKPQVKTSRSVLEQSGDPRLELFAEYGEWSSLENAAIPAFARGVYEPIHTRFALADTTRITSSAPNIQNPRSKAGIRECIVPRPGCCFVTIDHGGLENAALAQTIKNVLGLHGFVDFINGGGDLHCLVASEVAGCSYAEALRLYAADDPAFKKIRSSVKPVNFGRPGGAGWKTLKFIAKQVYRQDWTEAETKSYIAAWERAVPDGKAYLQWVGRLPQDGHGLYSTAVPGTTIQRRALPYCSAANNGFQALGTVAECLVGWAMFRERLSGHSVLSRCAMVNFVHDEWIWEVPIGLQTAAAVRLEHHMTEAPRAAIPDVHLAGQAVAMSCWSKSAKRMVDPVTGELQIWHP